ncbi:MAG: ABC transporter permease [Zetaproteobacteria bacterium CG12_big_fil_rev_8_21_14_0_65_55_1124]|nr:MAG: ABC transporter permease [Zetaproteobacteria bacterium CG1_02_55_237]PIS18911.1 MAG: ABC transporter permease [Zetaproteobacteria bacterium CG08_land_8_20_14_0_20_55_17]PIW41874.1 MAG: ABC transporter permease [Zetaproteobacteria bacterium CG12_big_fil_rev_8_21_14_0_65_55_1124]PIY53477.1 MAG: ABC transporter permease [Zetaproteobacteria bacterium CG_4_10_14_0_8_um_filter_55_43]PIZ39507.1 MAG: ABC transporter permease [Zetaproteobacteria bacterium CG_4_10_14_0_2_um_filter_55_20]PJB81715
MQLYLRLLEFLKPYRGRVALAMGCMVILAACTAATAWALQPALDEALSGKNPELIYLIPLLVIVLYIIKGVAYYGQATLMGHVGQRVIYDLRNRIYDQLTYQSLEFFAHRKVGEMLARISYDVTLVQAAVSTSVTALMRDSVSIVFLLGVVFYQEWMLAVIAMLVFPLVIYPIARFGKRMRHASFDGQVSMGEMSSLVEETVGGIRVVKAFGMEDYERSRFRRLTGDFLFHQLRMIRVQALSFPIMELLAGFGIAGVLLYGGMRVASGQTTAGTLVSFLAALIMLYEPVKRLSRANNEIQQGLAAAERLFDILDERVAVEDAADAKILNDFSRSVCFDRVGLQYPNTDAPVLRDVSFEVMRGEVVALVGRSGAGKTSLVNLVPRFMDVSGGAVLIDGQDVRRLTQASLRSQMAMVTQEIVLFNDTVRNNIAYGLDASRQKDIEAVAKAANAHDFITALPEGYDTLVGERGVILSGGQRQRLSLARALLKDAPILILDEATSALDTESERLVQQAIDRLMHGRTVIVIAHRLSTIRHASRIVVLEGGNVAQIGTHDELIVRGGLYGELYHMQFESQLEAQQDVQAEADSEAQASPAGEG